MSDLRERLLHPRAGWLSFGLLLVMALSVAWSVQGAKWLADLEFLVPVAAWAVLAGALLGMLRGSIVIALPLGALFGAGIIVWAIGGEYYPDLDQVDRLLALRADAIGWLRIVIETGYPPQMSPYAAGLGVLMFGTAFAAAFTIYRHDRVLDAIVLLGVAMVANVSATLTDLFALLMVFVVASLLLWLRATLADRQDAWQRRRISENLEVPQAIVRSGVIFAAGSVVLAWILTTVAVAAPLQEAWRGLDGVWVGARDQLEGIFGSLTNPQSRISGSTFGSSFTIAGEWISSDDEVLSLTARRPLYLRTNTLDQYHGRGFGRSEWEPRAVAAEDLLFPSSALERPTVEESAVVERIEIEMLQTIGRNLFTAGSPLRVLTPSVVLETAGAPVLGGIEHATPLNPGDTYQVQTAISIATRAQLGAAGRDYPPEVQELYLDTPGLTDRVAALAQEVTADAENDYERVAALTAYLKSDPSFTYSTKGEVPRNGEDFVDWFLFSPEADRTGYCEYFATTLAIMVRSLGLPARVAVGFAPGERQEDLTYLVRESSAHAWVEVYFPGYGWQIFESTPPIDPGFTRPTGVVGPVNRPLTPGADPFGAYDVFRETPVEGDVEVLPIPSLAPAPVDESIGAGDDQGRSGNALLIAAIILGALVVVWLRLRVTQRSWRLLPAGDRAWRQLTAAAERAGVGQRPSETIYEYAGWLEEQLPKHGEPIRTVADGKVLQSYSGRRMTMAGTRRLEEALGALRMPMIGLALRHWARRLSRKDPGL
ncbi:MAG TPA: transglutaminaseTgpA domain-containing protein [Candidatus Limnocylindria bacterium]